MPCCGQKRSSLSTTPTPSRLRQSIPADPLPPVAATTELAGSLALRYVGAEATSLRGPHSGRGYHVAGGQALVTVDLRDLQAMLRTGLFVLNA